MTYALPRPIRLGMAIGLCLAATGSGAAELGAPLPPTDTQLSPATEPTATPAADAAAVRIEQTDDLIQIEAAGTLGEVLQVVGERSGVEFSLPPGVGKAPIAAKVEGADWRTAIEALLYDYGTATRWAPGADPKGSRVWVFGTKVGGEVPTGAPTAEEPPPPPPAPAGVELDAFSPWDPDPAQDLDPGTADAPPGVNPADFASGDGPPDLGPGDGAGPPGAR